MNYMMVSIGKYIEANLAAFGLTATGDLKYIEKPKSQLSNGSKQIILLSLRTLPDHTRGVPFDNLISDGQKGERFLTLVEFECRTRAPDPSKDFYWNTVRQLRDKVYDALAGTYRGGLTIPRKNWTDPAHPTTAGEIWFEVDPAKNTPLEDPVEDPDDQANKSIFLTYNVHWWKPVV